MIDTAAERERLAFWGPQRAVSEEYLDEIDRLRAEIQRKADDTETWYSVRRGPRWYLHYGGSDGLYWNVTEDDAARLDLAEARRLIEADELPHLRVEDEPEIIENVLWTRPVPSDETTDDEVDA